MVTRHEMILWAGAVVLLLATSATRVLAQDPYVYINVDPTVSISTRADSIGGGSYLADFELESSFWVSGDPVVNPVITFTAAPGGEIFQPYAEQATYFSGDLSYLSFETVGAGVSQMYAEVESTPGNTLEVPSLPITVTRSVDQPNLTHDVEVQNLTVSLRIDQPLPLSSNLMQVALAPWGNDSLHYSIINSSGPVEFTPTWNGFFEADPAVLQVGQTYEFEAQVEVSRFDDLAGGSLYHQPRAEVTFGQFSTSVTGPDTQVTVPLSTGHTLAMEMDTPGTFDVATWTDPINVDMEPIATPIGAPVIDNVFIRRGQQTAGGTIFEAFGVSIEGQNLVTAQVETPTGAVYDLVDDDFDLEVLTTDSSLLSDFTPGDYIITAWGSDSSASSLSTTVTLGPDPGLAEFPQIIAPTGDITDDQPTIEWLPPQHPQLLDVIACFGENHHEEWEQWLDPSATSFTLPVPLEEGGVLSSIAFGDVDQGSTAEGVDYQAIWYTYTSDWFNIRTSLPGDLNGDGSVDALDIQYQVDQPDDLNFDGLTNQQDIEHLVENLMGFCMGDVNLDGSVDEADLAYLADGWKLVPPDGGPYDWTTADFTGDGLINEADLAYLADSWKQVCPSAGTAVPEPMTLTFAAPLLLMSITRLRG